MPQPSRPNILILYSDQLNARCLSCAGHPDAKTPHLDALAASGVRFSNAFVQNSICTPSRMSFLCGLYPSTHGYYGLYGREPAESLTSLFRYFGRHGYRTGALGKLHTPRYWIERDCQFVYDEFIEFPKYLEGAGLYESNDNRRFTGWKDGEASALPLEHSCEAALAKQTVRFIENLGEPGDRGDSEAPWLAWVSFSRPHSPITPSEPYASMYDPEELTLPPSANPEACTGQAKWSRAILGSDKAAPPEPLLRRVLAAYLGVTSQTDWGVGRIMQHLEQTGRIENTIVVFATDHGDYAGEFGLWSKTGGIRSSAITRTPLIVSSPGRVERDVATDEMAESVDVFPTLCELAGVEVPNHLQGLSLAPLLGPRPQAVRDSALTENALRKALTTKRWRYLLNIEGEPDELYDREADPWEMHNLANSPDHADVLSGLRRTLLQRLAAARRPVTSFDAAAWRHDYDIDGRSTLAGMLEKPDYA